MSQRSLVEHLESRVLMSAAIMKPEYVLYGRTNSPHDTLAPTGLSPAQIRQAYNFNLVSFAGGPADGSGQTIAIVDAYNDPNIAADLHTFDVQYGLSDPSLTVVNENGGSTLPGTDPAGRGNSWALEIALDVEWAHAAAPGAKILLVEASSASNSDLMAAVNTARNYTGVSVVSMSWGGNESSSDPSNNSYFTTLAGHTGVTFLASSGDGGAYGASGSRKTVEYPAASPNVIAVGGTTLTIDSSGNYISESGWGNGTSSSRLGGSGGGLSLYESIPTWQKGIVTQSTTMRALPDVALDADPNSGVSIVDSWDAPSAPWYQIGGTSMASPIWAGLIAVANEGRQLAGKTAFTGNQAVTALYSLSSSDFHDVTTGNNGYAAGPGFDLVTGRGTPIANLLVADLVNYGSPASGPVFASFSGTPSSALAGASITLNASVSDATGTVTSVNIYMESNGTAGLQVGSDTLIGTATKNGSTWTLTTTAPLTPGAYTYYAVAVDSASKSATVSTPLTVVAPTIASLTVSPGTTIPGTTVTATANSALENGGSVTAVNFYEETNGIAGYQAGDKLLGTGVKSGNNWVLSFSTAGMALGTYTLYAIAQDSAGIQSNIVSASLTLTATTNNDNFANGFVLSGNTASATGSNVGATRESGEPYITNNVGGHSVWWTWTATASGTVTIDTSGSNFDTMLGVYTGSTVSSLSLVAQNDDANRSTLTSAVTFSAVAGTTYHIAVDGYNGATGSINLHVNEVPAPSNDSVNSPVVLTGNVASWSGTNVGATRDPGQPTVAGNSGGASIWFKWTATTSGVANVNTSGSNFDTILGVFQQTNATTIQLIASNDDVSHTNLTSSVSFNATAGTTYYFMVDGYNGATGSVTINLSE